MSFFPDGLGGGFLPDQGGGIASIKSGGGSFTSGAVLFGATDGKITEDPTKLFWDDTNNRLGIGTNAPSTPFHIQGLVDGVQVALKSSATVSYLGFYRSTDAVGAADGAQIGLNGTNLIIINRLAGSAQIFTSGLLRWDFSAAGHLLAGTDNTYDIGASGANRPRDLFLGRNAVIGGALDHDGNTVGFYGVTPVARSTGWTITNDVTDRTFDANGSSTAELADVLATLIRDLAATGIIGAVA